MSQYEISPELDEKLRLSLENQGQFLEDISFVYALQAFPILVPSQIFYFELKDTKVLPVFTSEADLEVFKKSLTGDETGWELRSIRDVLPALLATDIETVAFNPKLSTDKSNGNTVYFDKKDLFEFIGHYTEILNVMLDPENTEKDRLDRTYLIPSFIWKDQDNEDLLKRAFTSLVAKNEQEYIPIFDNMNSFATWYNNPYFANDFKANNGQVLALTLADLRHPKDGENVFAKAVGVTINPLDATNEDYEKSLMTWSEIG